ncbi:hypothetical protein ACO0LF_19515 [Undibacterium sp. Di27W]
MESKPAGNATKIGLPGNNLIEVTYWVIAARSDSRFERQGTQASG